MDIFVILFFCGILITCAVCHISTILALFAGLVLFLLYGLYRQIPFGKLLRLCLNGIKAVGNIIVLMFIIGILTALWRASGCIPTIVCYASRLIHPSIILLMTFLLNALVSYLTGTSFGTVATMGVICSNIAYSLGVSPLWAGGAVLSGVFFGDRCSPVSSSALLVATITDTNIYANVKSMFRSGIIPFALSSLFYLAAGLLLPAAGTGPDITAVFSLDFRITPLCLLPAVSILILTILKLEVKLVMLISTLLSAVLACTVQHMTLLEILQTAVWGYSSKIDEVAPLVNGGGFVSMVEVCLVVLIACCYSGIFEETGLLNFLRDFAARLADRHTNFIAVLLLAAITCMLSCNQSLAILLTSQLSAKMNITKEDLALYIEDTVITIAALIPWSIAASVPLATIGAPRMTILFACYLYLIPGWQAVYHKFICRK